MDDFRLDITSGELTREGDTHRLGPKATQVLLTLAQNAGEAVSREQFQRQVWAGRIVTDDALNRCISSLRLALGDTERPRRYIETLPKLGYRLCCGVSFEGTGVAVSNDQPVETPAPGSNPPSRARLWVLGAISLFSLVLLLVVLLPKGPTGVTKHTSTESLLVRPLPSRSIVVLPFDNFSSDPEQSHFADGLTEELLNLLARIPELRVISRSTAFSLRGKSLQVDEIAQRLNVGYVLEGSVRVSGAKLRITAQLIDALSDTHLWSESYDRQVKDVFQIQDEIAQQVVEHLKITLAASIPRTKVVNVEAYSKVLQARFLMGQMEVENNTDVVELLLAAIELEPDYARPHILLSNTYNRMGIMGSMPRDEALAKSRAALERGMTIDPDNVAGHVHRGWLAMVWDHDLKQAAVHYQRAIDLDPDPARALWAALDLLMYLGRRELTITILSQRVEDNPTSASLHASLSHWYASAGQNTQALASIRTAMQLNPDLWHGYWRLGSALLLSGDVPSAIQAFDRERNLDLHYAGLAMSYHSLGNIAASDAALASLIELEEKRNPIDIAYVHAWRADADKAFLQLDAVTIEQSNSDLAFLQPWLRNLHSDPRWQVYLHRVGRSEKQLSAIKIDLPGGAAPEE